MTSVDLFSLRGQRILVTGAAGHVGRALCRHLSEDGAIIIAVDRDEKGLMDLEADLTPATGAFHPLAVDLADHQQRIKLAERVSSLVTRLDGAVFAAAFVGTSDLQGWAVDFLEQSVSSWSAALEVNLTAPFHLTQVLAPLLQRGTDPSIVNVGSIYGSLGPDWHLYEGVDMSNPAGYAVSKAGLIQLSKWLAATLAPSIRVNTVSPGGIARGQDAKFIERYASKTPLGRMATESDIVGQIALLLSPASGYTTGQNIVIDGGMSVV